MLACAVLIAGDAVPAQAAGGGGDGTGSLVVGGFAIGDGLEGLIDESDGSFQIDLPVGGLRVRWDSRAAGVDPAGLGPGWDWGLRRIERRGGLRVVTASGAVHGVDATHPSGLAGYDSEEVRFEARAGTLESRALAGGAARSAVDYAFALHELGGSVSYFSEAGDPVAQLDAVGQRRDWVWHPSVPHRLVETIDPDGVRTILDWERDPGAVLVETTTDGAERSREPAVWRIELDGGRVSGVTDPLGGRTRVGYARDSGLLSDVTGPSGAATRVDWRAWPDGVQRVDRVRTVDIASGAELSMRTWSPAADGALPSGWPGDGEAAQGAWTSESGSRYATSISDGATRVESTYDGRHLLVGRRVIGSTGSGDTVLREAEFDTLRADGGANSEAAGLPADSSRSSRASLTFRDQHGNRRTVVESELHDAFGRVVERTATDGTVTTTEYDAEIPAGRRLPVGLPVTERSAAPDGQVTTKTHALDPTRTAIVATEVALTTAEDDDQGQAEPTVTQYAEFDVDARGTVTEERLYPAGVRDDPPVVTRRRETLDPVAGTRTRTETVGVGTSGEASSTEVTSLVHGEVVESVDELGNATRTELDALGRAVRVTDALGRVTVTTHETAQTDGRNAVTTTTPDGVSVTEVRDALGRTIQVLDDLRDGRPASGHARVVERREYPAPGTLVVTDAWGATTTTKTDAFGRQRERTLPTGLVEITAHDDVGDTVTVGLTTTGSLADAELVTTQRRDAAGRIVEEGGHRADGVSVPTVTTSYDGLGRTLGTSSELLTTEVGHDVRGNPVRTTFTPGIEHDPAAGLPIVEERRFDGMGHSLLKTVSDRESARPGVERVVDGLGRTVSETDQAGRVTTTSYTPDGLVARVVAGSGQVTEHEYHPVTRVVTGTVVTSPIGEPVRTAYEHDPLTDRVIGVWDPADRTGTEIRTEWDAHGNPTRVVYPDGEEIGHRYDAHGRRTHTTDIAGNVTTFEHDGFGRLSRVVQHDRRGERLAEVGYERDRFDRIIRLARGNGLVTETTFTSASEIASEHTTKDGATVSRRAYEYDASGNLTQRSDTIVDADGSGGEGEETTVTEYRYDAHHRLIRSTEHLGELGGPVTRDTEYALAASDDVTAEVVTTDPGTPGEVRTSRRFVYDPLGGLGAIHRISTGACSEGRDGCGGEEVRTQTYDAAGNLTTAADGTAYDYDAANRPVREIAADGTTTRTGYWADGSRRERTSEVDGVAMTSSFYWDDDTLLNDRHDGGAETQRGVAAYLVGEARHARTTSSASESDQALGTTYLGADRHGSVVELSTESGEISSRPGYSDYGSALHADAAGGLDRNPFGYAGEYTDPIGTQHLAERSYDPATMRFLTQDRAERHNLFNYADLNPITNVDPTGRAPQADQPMAWERALFLALDLVSLFLGASMAVASVVRAIWVARLANTAFNNAVRLAVGTMAQAGTSILRRPNATLTGMPGVYAYAGVSVTVNATTSAVGAAQLWNKYVHPIYSDKTDGFLRGVEILGTYFGGQLAMGVAYRRWTVTVQRGPRRLKNVIRGDAYHVREIDTPDQAFKRVLDRENAFLRGQRAPVAPANVEMANVADHTQRTAAGLPAGLRHRRDPAGH